jgi:hypothetical protein
MVYDDCCQNSLSNFLQSNFSHLWSYMDTQFNTRERSLVRHIFSHKLMEDFWRWGEIPSSTYNGTAIYDPWSGSPAQKVAPFDQAFHLILNVAVGGTNGYFLDGQNDQNPWSNQAENPRADFWAQKDLWNLRGLLIHKSVEWLSNQSRCGNYARIALLYSGTCKVCINVFAIPLYMILICSFSQKAI